MPRNECSTSHNSECPQMNNSKNAVQDKSANIRESINNKMNAEQVITTSTPESTKNTFILVEV